MPGFNITLSLNQHKRKINSMTLQTFRALARRIAAFTVVAAVAAASTGCDDSFLFDYEGDCDPYFKARFRFDMNLHYADAFPNEVNAVTLYLIDPETGNIVWQRSESGDRLKEDGYLMDIDVAPGDYQVMAWCGEGVGQHFTVPVDADHHTHLTCTLGRNAENDGATVRDDIKRLYHGAVRNDDGSYATVNLPDEEGVHIIDVPLIKDTNDVNIVLQHLSGVTVDASKYTFTITDNNGYLNWDNTILDDEAITYYAHHVSQGTAGVPAQNAPAAGRANDITTLSACLAEHTVSRLVKGQDARVKVYYEGKAQPIIDIPLIDYALMMKTTHYSHMTDQEYLDRQDKYDITFFLDERDHWMYATINVLAWSVVVQNTDL
ncbi:MAG: FimB/Mfa2 family fimbrial subunit [Muribaculaceae bacterium]|nr:FimB/Mfa2 family fimbrial subunit [Muribaculaceae bacterium]